MEDYLRVGVVTSPHGIKGEVKVFPTTDDINRYKQLKKVYLDFGKEKKELQVEGVKFFKQMAILKFKGFDRREEIDSFRQKDLLVSREDALPLEEDEYYLCDIIGARVVTDEGTELGTLTEVLQTGANDVYVVKSVQGRDILIPCIKECLLDVDTEAKKVLVHLLPGLLSL